MNKAQTLKVEIWSDIVCPFCFLGKRKFEQALEQFDHKQDIEIIWRSFQLNPGVQTDTSMSVYTYLSRTKGIPEEVAKQMTQQITERGLEVGIEYKFDETAVNNTLLVHCFLHYALDQGKQNEAKELLLSAYFEKGANVDDLETIMNVGRILDFDEGELRAVLTENRYEKEVIADMELAQRFGVRGVPFFVFDRKYAVSGAQEITAFIQTLIKAHDDWKNSLAGQTIQVTEGEGCSTDDNNCA